MTLGDLRDRSVVWLMLVAGVAGCSDADRNPVPEPEGASTAAITYHRDIAPLLADKCVSCHQAGQIGEGPLDTYDAVVARGPAVKQQVAERLMPPWHAGDGCNDYVHDPSMTQEQIDALVGWIDGGMPEGNPAEAAPAEVPELPSLPRVDLSVEMPVDYMPKEGGADDYHCFVLDVPGDATRYVTGIGVHPGNASTVHHVIAFFTGPEATDAVQALDDAEPGPGYTCYGGAGTPVQQTGTLGGWVPGVAPAEMPAGTGIRLEAGSKIILQVHYNLVTWDGAPDRTRLDLMLDDPVEREAWSQFFTNPMWLSAGGMPIPAGDPAVTHSFTAPNIASFLTEGDAFDVFSVGMHMHTRGHQARVAIERQGGASECLLDVPQWDFNWQGSYGLTQPTRVEPGDGLSISCTWNNSMENQPAVDGMAPAPQAIEWGDGTDDEMCLGTLYVAKAK